MRIGYSRGGLSPFLNHIKCGRHKKNPKVFIVGEKGVGTFRSFAEAEVATGCSRDEIEVALKEAGVEIRVR